MAENKRTTVIRLMQLDNNPSLLTSMVMPMVPITGGFLFRPRDTFKRQYITRAGYMNRYRKELEKFKDKKIVIRARVDKRRTKDYISPYGNKYKVDTMLLKDVRCGVIRDNKFYVIERVHHLWISGETSKIVNNFKIKPGHEVMFGATVIEYQYKNGKTQLGVIQTSKKHNFK